jgi:hypothetical protein
MASERQIAANRRNGIKSTGPRSSVGKKRVSRNALRHGFSSRSGRADTSEAVESLVRKICGEKTDALALEHARAAAEAIVELNRVREAKLSLIDRAAMFGALQRPRHFKTDNDEVKWLIKMDNWMMRGSRGRRPNKPRPEDFLSSMPVKESEKCFEAIRRILPELKKLERYETRAAARRDQAIRALMRSGTIIAA